MKSKEFLDRELHEFAERIKDYNYDILMKACLIQKQRNLFLQYDKYNFDLVQIENHKLKVELSDLRLSQSIHKRKNKELRLKVRNLEKIIQKQLCSVCDEVKDSVLNLCTKCLNETIDQTIEERNNCS